MKLALAVVLLASGLLAIWLTEDSRLDMGATVVEAKCPSPGPPRANDHLTYRWAGKARSSSTFPITRVDANIENTSPWVEPVGPGTSSVSAWVQLVDVTQDVWAKSGWIEYPGGVRHELYEWREADGTHGLLVGPQPGSYALGARVSRDASNGLWKIWAGPPSAPILRLSIYLHGYTTLAQMAGETHSLADQMPGGTGSENWSYFENARVQIAGAFSDLGGTEFNSLPSEYGLFTTFPSRFSVWDKKCTS